MKPYDWTYTTGYRGDVEGLEVAGTEERIDYEQLKKQERIEFYDDIILFEDELADNGTAVLSVKMVGNEQHLCIIISAIFFPPHLLQRVMGSGFFILQRFFLRVDGVLVRINDTRVHHKVGGGSGSRPHPHCSMCLHLITAWLWNI